MHNYRLFILVILITYVLSIDSDTSCTSADITSYNLEFHVFGLFIILISSSFGIIFTSSLGSYNKNEYTLQIIHYLKMFGIGIMAATAWIHLVYNIIDF